MVRQFILISLLFPFCIQANHFEMRGSIHSRSGSTLEEVGKVGICVGAAGLAAYGLAKLGKWIFSQSDEQCLAKARELSLQVRTDYGSLLSLLEQKYHGYFGIEQRLLEISEDMLYKLSLMICPQSSSGYSLQSTRYIRAVRDMVEQLASYEDSLSKRLYDLNNRSSYDSQVVNLRYSMNEALADIHPLFVELRFAYDYLNYHQSYFELFESEFMIMARYDLELRAVERYGDNYFSVREFVHQGVMVYQRDHHEMYPYRKYLHRLETDMAELAAVMKHQSHNYYYRLQAAQTLRRKLETIRQVAAGSPVYADELRAIEYARLEQERIAAQRENARALENQARAMENQANELKRQRECYEDCCCDDCCCDDNCCCG